MFLESSRVLENKKSEFSVLSNFGLGPRRETVFANNKERETIVNTKNQGTSSLDITISPSTKKVIDAVILTERRMNQVVKQVADDKDLSAAKSFAYIMELNNLVLQMQNLIKIANYQNLLREQVLRNQIIS